MNIFAFRERPPAIDAVTVGDEPPDGTLTLADLVGPDVGLVQMEAPADPGDDKYRHARCCVKWWMQDTWAGSRVEGSININTSVGSGNTHTNIDRGEWQAWMLPYMIM
jgi:hypothetical protein